jgi:cytochrome c nitrite reductase small subunit
MRRGSLSLLVAGMLGIAAGSGAFTFVYAEGGSYLRDDAAACANCHIMGAYLKAWERGSHRSAARCNDCHAPHGSLVAKLGVKAINGLKHSWVFTTGDYPDSLQITAFNRRVTEGACRHCHAEVVSGLAPTHRAGAGSLACIRCHAEVGHP